MDTLLILATKYLYLLVVLGVIFFVLRASSLERKKILLLALLTLPLTYLVAKALSTVYYDPRPFVTEHVVPLVPHDPDNGFPSDHTLLSAALASVIFFFHRRWGMSLFVLAFLVGLVRVLAHIHHLVDIMGSLVIAAVVTWLVSQFLFPRVQSWNVTKRILKLGE